jgi:alanyl-tRNA synthetase
MTGNEIREKSWTGNDIREAFLRFFEGKGHRRVRSSSLVPHGDATLLFTNAGMNQFKDVFLGLEKRDYNKATSAQKCVRAGGKHNDLENVGFTKRHHTFFEMLGNFSFGDYFKKDAIAYAWELITSPQWFAISKDKLYVTVFGATEVSPGQLLGSDHEAKVFWVNEGVPQDRISEIPGLKENFWAMGDTGPCGPCSEIFYDMGPFASEEGHANCSFPCDCGRYVEFWNLVFMQFNRDTSGVLAPLPKPCVDTGMGLERVAAILQGVISNYDTDLFRPLMSKAADLLQHDMTDADEETSRKIIADHSRAATFLISDGVIPSNDGRGGVLRKIVNRALVNMGAPETISEQTFPAMADAVVGQMREAYPELQESIQHVRRVLASETARFRRTMTVSLGKLDAEVTLLRKTQPDRSPETGGLAIQGPLVLPGDAAFKLYDTFGLAKDVMDEAARLQGVSVDWAGFDAAMRDQRERGRASWKGGTKEAAKPVYAQIADAFGPTGSDFYSVTTAKDCKIEVIVKAGTAVSQIEAGETAEVILDRTAIYAESGGQVADTGTFYDNSESQELAEVTGAFYPVVGLVAHRVVAKETLRVGDRVAVVADAERRERIKRNHSGTHLVHTALRNILGTHVKQAGSLNDSEHLRFDFVHFKHVDPEELRDIEQQVNEEIRHNTKVETNITSLDEALASGALAFFGDKYPESNVRVVTIPDERAPSGFYSKELCGGTHVHRIGDIGVLKIVSEESVAAGVRRVEAVTGIGALQHYQKSMELLRSIAQLLHVGDEKILMRLSDLAEKTAALENQLEVVKRIQALNQANDLMEQVQTVKGVKVIAAEVQNVDREGLRQLVDSLRQKLGSGVVALGMPEDGKVALIAGVTKDLTGKVHAGKLIQALAKQVGGSGGGRPDLAEAGGKDPAALKSALLSIPSLLEGLL